MSENPSSRDRQRQYEGTTVADDGELRVPDLVAVPAVDVPSDAAEEVCAVDDVLPLSFVVDGLFTIAHEAERRHEAAISIPHAVIAIVFLVAGLSVEGFALQTEAVRRQMSAWAPQPTPAGVLLLFHDGVIPSLFSPNKTRSATLVGAMRVSACAANACTGSSQGALIASSLTLLAARTALNRTLSNASCLSACCAVTAEWVQYYPADDAFAHVWVRSSACRVSVNVRAFSSWSTELIGASVLDVCAFTATVLMVARWVVNARGGPRSLGWWALAMELCQHLLLMAAAIARFVWWSRTQSGAWPAPTTFPDLLVQSISVQDTQRTLSGVALLVVSWRVAMFLGSFRFMRRLLRGMGRAASSQVSVVVLWVLCVALPASLALPMLLPYHSTYFSATNTWLVLGTVLTMPHFVPDASLLPVAMTAWIVRGIFVGSFAATFAVAARVIPRRCRSGLPSKESSEKARAMGWRPFARAVRRLYARARIRRELADFFQGHLDFVERCAPELLDDVFPVSLADVIEWLPPDLRASMGRRELWRIWQTVLNDYAESRAGPANRCVIRWRRGLKAAAAIARPQSTPTEFVTSFAELSASLEHLARSLHTPPV